MAYPPRVEFPGAVYHVMNRGNRKAEIYLDDRDRVRFLALLQDCVTRFGWLCHAYCLMGNHYHLLIETSSANLGQGMQRLAARYSRWFNWRHGQSGHLFQGRYKAILVDKQGYLLELARYLALNPVRGGLAQRPEDWLWSSYPATIGRAAAPAWLETGWLLEQFGPVQERARHGFSRFVAEGRGQDRAWQPDIRDGVLGDAAFRAALNRRLGREVCSPARPPLAALAESGGPRGAWMSAAYRDHGYRLGEIAAVAELSKSSVSRTIAAWTARERA